MPALHNAAKDKKKGKQPIVEAIINNVTTEVLRDVLLDVYENPVGQELVANNLRARDLVPQEQASGSNNEEVSPKDVVSPKRVSSKLPATVNDNEARKPAAKNIMEKGRPVKLDRASTPGPARSAAIGSLYRSNPRPESSPSPAPSSAPTPAAIAPMVEMGQHPLTKKTCARSGCRKVFVPAKQTSGEVCRLPPWEISQYTHRE
ncbi:hypothetical protein QBC35DRAFT_479110 [Podospora australis]|uniref:Uncharacterized protein n=1 Tax=Podospora australis TaxID=1536484 RepID=A0AAN6WIG4_9PEZI|nr:hypothetical protein QBC35DRAFT_479110 [Podospora australis]